MCMMAWVKGVRVCVGVWQCGEKLGGDRGTEVLLSLIG